MDARVYFFKRLISYSYTCYARSADGDDSYFPWDNVHFKTKEECEKHMKLLDHDWLTRLVVVKVQHEIVT
jgi:hypothetical protein